ncbi:tRNA lysidine(34) synthetase TilS [Ideonella sp.]|uniref:tRNA lysidine(34) synthetase TilS n=1 Tax=Ideonella sp. TaxID=1929293 RepID=UPI002B486595|nr:tRNA lysidine(34) synthetase TilS [Ideonella sp.]HJV70240.1 tRNA lysidine(34) synthetase TilS [Ideonella sp.]
MRRAGATPIVAVAASGGRDSTALLHATVHAARGTALLVIALHVHHGLNPAADSWQQHLQRQCARWARAGLPVALLTHRLNGSPARGESVEAWARRERYRALAAMAREAGAGVVMLAHHRRDQAETFLLQALRGAGPAGLAAMPREVIRDGLLWCRPWLDQPAEAIRAYVARHRLSHIDDDSNRDRRFDRNRLRHDVWPALLAAFPHAEATLALAAHQAQWAIELIDDVAETDLAAVRAAAPSGLGDRVIDVAAWQALPAPRRVAVLRRWLAPLVSDGVRDSLIDRLGHELAASRTARWPLDGVRELRLYRGRLTVGPVATRHARSPAPTPMRLDRPGVMDLPDWGGRLELEAVEQGGVAAGLLARAALRARAPGDTFQFSARSTARSLKKQYQARAVPAWLRGGPVIACEAHPVFVPGLGIDARALAVPGEPQLLIRWHPAS